MPDWVARWTHTQSGDCTMPHILNVQVLIFFLTFMYIISTAYLSEFYVVLAYPDYWIRLTGLFFVCQLVIPHTH